jgi:hypothetical protein
MLITKPRTKHMANRYRLGQISSIENKPPNHFCGRAIYKQVLYGFIHIAADTLLAPFPVFLRKVIFFQNDPLLKKPKKNFDL